MKRFSDHPDAATREMMNATDTCLCCGAHLRYLAKQKRRNRGYCSLDCYYRLPPKLAYACREWGMGPGPLMVHLLERNTVTATAELLGVRKQSLYRWMRLYGVRRSVAYHIPVEQSQEVGA